MQAAKTLIEQLGLAPHPEGGWYRETWRAPASDSARSAGTAILFLLDIGQRSHWHRIDATELWIHQAGAPLLMRLADDGGPARSQVLGTNVTAGEQPQCLVPPRQWQSAQAMQAWSLVTCVVVPAFEFGGFELAPANWQPDSK